MNSIATLTADWDGKLIVSYVECDDTVLTSQRMQRGLASLFPAPKTYRDR